MTAPADVMGEPLHGIIPPLVTPLSGHDELDAEGLDRLVEHVIRGDVSTLFVLGTTGEGPGLSHRLRKEMVSETCRAVAGRLPVLVCISDTVFEESVELAEHAAACGADAVVASTPYYFRAGQPELVDYFTLLSQEAPLPLYLYNMPAMTKLVIQPETVARLMEIPSIVGIKDSSGELDYFACLIELGRSRRDWSVVMGPEELTSQAVRMGAHGGVNGGANLFPALHVANHRAAAAGDVVEAERLDRVVKEVAAALYTVGSHPSSMLKGLKCALSLRGICGDMMAHPFESFHARERALLGERLEALIEEHQLS
ncbi:dihydrodipicolinate synthase family protein [Luteolibacter sp. SL250]|uniref:dihydrodipicolinate synthase family protein n=1 Tax=Luteolibacter sp. SL250 TaxID=2995170 RepID=UPI002271C1FF|nr:dihydrodipicolinate synthase family protein [Luteolibacter sp. SL250]WAC18438.1 dihydrodipicolinate synthase family protein [Luteolibacter sp. SL250]